MLKTSQQAIYEWEKLKNTDSLISNKKIVEEDTVVTGRGEYKKVTIHETDQKETVKDIFKLLQFYPDIYKVKEENKQGSKFQLAVRKENFV